MVSRISFTSTLLACLFLTSYLQAGRIDTHAEISASRLKARVGEEVRFSAAASRAGQDSELTGYSWDFNEMDLVPVDSMGREVTRVFNKTGAYTVKLTVEDNLGRRDEAFCSVEVMPDSDAGPSITSNFQGGRTGTFFAAPETFAFRLEWGNQFYFRLDNCRGREVSLRIVGYGPDRKQIPSVTPYSDDHTFDERFTLMYSTNYQSQNWKPYEKAAYSYESDSASLTVSFIPDTDSIYFAWAVPWTMRNLQEFLDRWEGSEYFSWRTIGSSVEGRPITALTVTDFSVDHKQKKAIWITGTQHAYEMAAGPVTEGIVSRLLDGSASSDDLLKNYVYNIIPLVNPDGVTRGGYRYNMHDIDLNRNWDSVKGDDWDSKVSEPEVACVKDAISGWVEAYGTLDLFFDFHCLTAIAENLLMIKASPVSIPEPVKKEQDRFVSDFLQKRWVFRESESLDAGNGNGYVADKYAAKTGVISFTPEHCLGFISTRGGEMERATPALFRRLGADYVELIDEYFKSRN